MNASLVFDSVAYKRLVAVDLPNKGSHQHELNGSRALGEVLGYEKLRHPIKWILLTDDLDASTEENTFTWYDARERSSDRTGRSEWRFYYAGDFLSKASIGDFLFLAKSTNGLVYGLLAKKDSQWLEDIIRFLGISRPNVDRLKVLDKSYLEQQDIPDSSNLLTILHFDHQPKAEPKSVKNKETVSTSSHIIRPAARLISTIGKDLIKDQASAIIELVKNAYDADSTKVEVQLNKFTREDGQVAIGLRIQDNGHGMPYNVVVNNWLVPATSYKSKKLYSPNGRRMQGNKGIGRYAAFLLGEEMLLKTNAETGEETTVLLNWNDFTRYEYLDEVPVTVEKGITESHAGTTFDILGNNSHAQQWEESELDALKLELRKLISPFRDDEDPFEVHLSINGFPEPYANFQELVQPLSLAEFYDYRLYGVVDPSGKGTLIFENQAEGSSQPRDVELAISIDNWQQCGQISIDFRVFDRDPEAIDQLISRGLKDPETGLEMTKREARELLDMSAGISIYRGDFKIRPYGDPAYDWLELDKQRVQNPSLRIGNNQILGYIRIAPEQESHLEEKSARDGLRENAQYGTLKRIARVALAELEQRRFVFRKESGRGRKLIKLAQTSSQLTNYDTVIEKIGAILVDSRVPDSKIASVKDILETTKREQEALIDQIQETIAIYQGQATLGKIIMVILHGGRKPIGYFRDMSPILIRWIETLQKSTDPDLLQKLISRLENVKSQSEILTALFNRIEPLSVRRRHKAKPFSVFEPIAKSVDLFHSEFERIGIETFVDPRLKKQVIGWEEDFLLIFTNLLENSTFWFQHEKSKKPEIVIQLVDDARGPVIDYIDNGKGIPEELIRDQSIFEPGFSTRPGGTGLGLAIAGEAAERNGCRLKARYSPTGAHFILELFPGLPFKN